MFWAQKLYTAILAIIAVLSLVMAVYCTILDLSDPLNHSQMDHNIKVSSSAITNGLKCFWGVNILDWRTIFIIFSQKHHPKPPTSAKTLKVFMKSQPRGSKSSWGVIRWWETPLASFSTPPLSQNIEIFTQIWDTENSNFA